MNLPDLGSLYINRIIKAVNAEKGNPFPKSKDCQAWYDALLEDKRKEEREHPGVPIIFSPMEADDEELDALMGLLPNGYEDMIDALKK